MKKLIVIRHGNTFRSGEPPRRIGRRTDLPLVEEERARKAGRFLLAQNLRPDQVFSASLKRTQETAKLVLDEMNLSLPVLLNDDFLEIDYGPDENQTEDTLMIRLGREALKKPGTENQDIPDVMALQEGQAIIDKWNREALLPEGWKVDIPGLITQIRHFADATEEDETRMVVSSNGVIRFFPEALLDEEHYTEFLKEHNLKVSTGGVSVFEFTKERWHCTFWNRS